MSMSWAIGVIIGHLIVSKNIRKVRGSKEVKESLMFDPKKDKRDPSKPPPMCVIRYD